MAKCLRCGAEAAWLQGASDAQLTALKKSRDHWKRKATNLKRRLRRFQLGGCPRCGSDPCQDRAADVGVHWECGSSLVGKKFRQGQHCELVLE